MYFGGLYCKFGNFRENFIFAKNVKRLTRDRNNLCLGHDLPLSVNDRVISRGFYFHETLQRSSLIGAHCVCFSDKSSLECILIYATDIISRQHFLDKRKNSRIRVNIENCYLNSFLNMNSVVDNLQPTEIIVSFSSLSRWPEPPPPPVEEKKSHTSIKGGKDKIDEKEITHITSSSMLEGQYFS